MTTTPPSAAQRRAEQILEVIRDDTFDELHHILHSLRKSNLTTHEMIGLLAILRPIYDRVHAEKAGTAAVLRLVAGRPVTSALDT